MYKKKAKTVLRNATEQDFISALINISSVLENKGMDYFINTIYLNLFSLRDIFFIDYILKSGKNLQDNLLIMSKDFNLDYQYMTSLSLGEFHKILSRANHINKELSKKI